MARAKPDPMEEDDKKILSDISQFQLSETTDEDVFRADLKVEDTTKLRIERIKVLLLYHFLGGILNINKIYEL